MNWRTRFRYVFLPKIIDPLKAVGEFLLRIFTVYRVAVLLILLAIGIWYFTAVELIELWPNIIPDLFSIALTVLIIDTIYRKRSDIEVKKILISQMGSKSNAVATQAVTEFEARGWLSDGSLRGVFLMGANLDNNDFSGADMRGVKLSFASLKNSTWFEADLEGAFLDHVDFEGASLTVHAVGPHYAEANLERVYMANSNLAKANVRDEQFVRLSSLLKTIMPDGSIYDGRYNLSSDIRLFKKSAIDSENVNEWAAFYGVSLDAYLAGQAWAQSHPELFQGR